MEAADVEEKSAELYGTWPITFAVQEKAVQLLLDLYLKEASAELQIALLANVVLALGWLTINKLYTPRSVLWRVAARALSKVLRAVVPLLDAHKHGDKPQQQHHHHH